MNIDTMAKDYINIKLKNEGVNCVSIIDNQLKSLEGKTFVEFDYFLDEIEKAFKLGYNIKNCKGKTCINCNNYNGIGWFDENNIPQISCRLGGYHYGFDACDDFEQVENDSQDLTII